MICSVSPTNLSNYCSKKYFLSCREDVRNAFSRWPGEAPCIPIGSLSARRISHFVYSNMSVIVNWMGPQAADENDSRHVGSPAILASCSLAFCLRNHRFNRSIAHCTAYNERCSRPSFVEINEGSFAHTILYASYKTT